MRKRSLCVFVLACLMLAASFAAAPAAQAQQQDKPLYTYVSFWGVPRAQWGDIESSFEKVDKPILEKLVADGTLVSWGNSAVLVHESDGMTHNDWFQAASLENIMKARDALSKAAEAPVFANSKHFDVLLRTVVHGGKTATLKNGFLIVAFWRPKPGEGDAWLELFKRDYKPWLDEMVANGSATMYNVDEELIHTDAPGQYNIAVVVPDAASVDKFYAGIAAMVQKNPSVVPAIGGLVVGDAHRDIMARVTAYQHK
jgi:hypothetical protein